MRTLIDRASVPTLCMALCLLLCLAPCPPATADDAPTLSQSLAAFFAETDAAKRLGAGLALASRWPDAAEVADALPAARAYPADARTDDVVMWMRDTADGVSHTILANIPAGYDAAKPMPVFLWLHGAVSRDRDGGAASGIRAFKELSDEEGFLLLCPSAQAGSEWWTPNGVALVRGALADLAQRYHIDGNRVAVAGFSDGASGCFHLLAHDPEPYACFLPMMAHPGITRLTGGPSFHANVRARPVCAFNGGADALYPSVRIQPLMNDLKGAGCDLTWTDLPEAGHNLGDVLPEHWATLRDFWKAHPRTALPTSIRWESAVPSLDGRFGWVEVVQVDPKAPGDAALQGGVLPDPAGRAVLGVTLDQAYQGEGVKIGSVSAGSAAEEAGFLAGDVIVAVDGISLRSEDAFVRLRTALASLADRDGVFTVLRGEEEKTLSCRPRVAQASGVERSAALGYGLPSGLVEARVTAPNRIEVKTRHVGALKLHLASGLVDLKAPVTVVLNGAVVYQETPVGSVGYVLSEALRGGPGAPAWQAGILLKP
jgi:hypothetical protein